MSKFGIDKDNEEEENNDNDNEEEENNDEEDEEVEGGNTVNRGKNAKVWNRQLQRQRGGGEKRQ